MNSTPSSVVENDEVTHTPRGSQRLHDSHTEAFRSSRAAPRQAQKQPARTGREGWLASSPPAPQSPQGPSLALTGIRPSIVFIQVYPLCAENTYHQPCWIQGNDYNQQQLPVGPGYSGRIIWQTGVFSGSQILSHPHIRPGPQSWHTE